jgi:hypothetical protein
MFNLEINVENNVECKELGFVLQRIPATDIRPEAMIICAYLEDGAEIAFMIDPANDPGFKKWSMHLFYEAVEYYCQVVLDKETDRIFTVNDQLFYPYDNSTDYV